MGRNLGFLLSFIFLFFSLVVADWNILHHKGKYGLKISLKNYCESWRMNVEMNNILGFGVVPQECIEFIGKYMTSTQYKVDSERAIDECRFFLGTSGFMLKGDGKDAWIFDIDDTLLSTVPYYKKHHFGGDMLNNTALEGWMREGKAPALGHTLDLYNEIKSKGIKIFLISSRMEYLRDATTDNLVKVGYYGWSGLSLRGLEDDCKDVQQFKAEQRKRLIDAGFRIWGIVGDQWSSLKGLPSAKRTFKLPNTLYYIS